MLACPRSCDSRPGATQSSSPVWVLRRGAALLEPLPLQVFPAQPRARSLQANSSLREARGRSTVRERLTGCPLGSRDYTLYVCSHHMSPLRGLTETPGHLKFQSGWAKRLLSPRLLCLCLRPRWSVPFHTPTPGLSPASVPFTQAGPAQACEGFGNRLVPPGKPVLHPPPGESFYFEPSSTVSEFHPLEEQTDRFCSEPIPMPWKHDLVPCSARASPDLHAWAPQCC